MKQSMGTREHERKEGLQDPCLAFLPFDAPLVPARLVLRRDRFLCEAILERSDSLAVKSEGDAKPQRADTVQGEVPANPEGIELCHAHCVNPGRMEAFVLPGARIWLEPSSNPRRKLRYTWELLEYPTSEGRSVLCGTNTARPNKIVRKVLEARALPGLDDFVAFTPETTVTAGDLEGSGWVDSVRGAQRSPATRVDFLLQLPRGRKHFVEVKNCHSVLEGVGYFPDSVSERAARHVAKLAALVRAGHVCTVLFVVQRDDVVTAVRPSDFHDPVFACACRRAASEGVCFRALKVRCSVEGSHVVGELPVDLVPYDTSGVAEEWARNRDSTGWVRSASGTVVGNAPFPHNVPRVAPRKRPAPQTESNRRAVVRKSKYFAAPSSGSERRRSNGMRPQAEPAPGASVVRPGVDDSPEPAPDLT